MTDAPRFRPASQFEILNRHQVRYVLIGGVAARVHGSIQRTGDVDICPAHGDDNAERLAAALNELDARVYIDEDRAALATTFDAAFVANQAILNTMTRYGRLDIVWHPDGTDGFDELNTDAATEDILGQPVRVVSLDALIRCKQATGRDKDQETLAELLFIRDRRR